MTSSIPSGITDEMIERAARAWWDHARQHIPDSLAWDNAWGFQDPYRDAVRAAFEAALSGRVVVDLPASWNRPAVGASVEVEDGCVITTSRSAWAGTADETERYALALLAAAREARRMAESGEQRHRLCHKYDCPDAPRCSSGATVVHEWQPSCGDGDQA